MRTSLIFESLHSTTRYHSVWNLSIAKKKAKVGILESLQNGCFLRDTKLLLIVGLSTIIDLFVLVVTIETILIYLLYFQYLVLRDPRNALNA